ncbi:hypothetical protein N8I74_18875 [Chitiniphilus purpureus]|uniref:Secreted protein n=1 Tax=Chitiniphilus purpureus TaxID=2981137 RepID=A0ABY6DLX0_9NEIS|nr:hypothetical protein [Chitiniphilus sp. CD1]UXY15346.1 hypothetical protein N8I74_18875 [Chitiniphilus sp. CD1]
MILVWLFQLIHARGNGTCDGIEGLEQANNTVRKISSSQKAKHLIALPYRYGKSTCRSLHEAHPSRVVSGTVTAATVSMTCTAQAFKPDRA